MSTKSLDWSRKVVINQELNTSSDAVFNSVTTNPITGTALSDLNIYGSSSVGHDLLLNSNTSNNGQVRVLDTQEATNSSTGALHVDGGVSCIKNVYVGANVNVAGTTESTSSITGALVVSGGVGISKMLYWPVPHLYTIKGTQQSISSAAATPLDTFTVLENITPSGSWGLNTGAGQAYWTVPIDGLYMITADVSFETNPTGARSMFFGDVAIPGATDPTYGRFFANAVTGGVIHTYLQSSAVIRCVASTTKLSLTVYQTSGISLNVPSTTGIYDRTELSIVWLAP